MEFCISWGSYKELKVGFACMVESWGWGGGVEFCISWGSYKELKVGFACMVESWGGGGGGWSFVFLGEVTKN